MRRTARTSADLSRPSREATERPLRALTARSAAALLAAAVAIAASPPPYRPPFAAWSRANGGNPVLEPQRSGLEVGGGFNPAVGKGGGPYVKLYRAQDAQKTLPRL